MNKLLLLVIAIFAIQINFAQGTNFKKDVLKLISINGVDAQMKVVKPLFLINIPEDKREDFSKEFDLLLPSWYDKIAKIYMELYTSEDIKAMIAFYESPLGKKMSEKSSELTRKSMLTGEEWGRDLRKIMDKYKGKDSSQEAKNGSDNTVYNTAGIEVKPEFPGGFDKFYKFIAENYKTPNVGGLKGKVYVTFVIEKNGSLTDIKVLRDIGYGTGKEAIRVLKNSPKWLPGEQDGRKVRCTYSLPISIESK